MTQASGSFYYFFSVRKVHDCGREKANQTETTCLKETVFPVSSNGCKNTCAHINTHIHTHTHAYTKQFSTALFPELWTFLLHQSHYSLSVREDLRCYWIAWCLLAEDGEFRGLFSFWTVSVTLTVSLKYYRIYKHQIIIFFISWRLITIL